jgi:hypothetical protein
LPSVWVDVCVRVCGGETCIVAGDMCCVGMTSRVTYLLSPCRPSPRSAVRSAVRLSSVERLPCVCLASVERPSIVRRASVVSPSCVRRVFPSVTSRMGASPPYVATRRPPTHERHEAVRFIARRAAERSCCAPVVRLMRECRAPDASAVRLSSVCRASVERMSSGCVCCVRHATVPSHAPAVCLCCACRQRHGRRGTGASLPQPDGSHQPGVWRCGGVEGCPSTPGL